VSAALAGRLGTRRRPDEFERGEQLTGIGGPARWRCRRRQSARRLAPSAEARSRRRRRAVCGRAERLRPSRRPRTGHAAWRASGLQVGVPERAIAAGRGVRPDRLGRYAAHGAPRHRGPHHMGRLASSPRVGSVVAARPTTPLRFVVHGSAYIVLILRQAALRGADRCATRAAARRNAEAVRAMPTRKNLAMVFARSRRACSRQRSISLWLTRG
jgi:hypothetical protein